MGAACALAATGCIWVGKSQVASRPKYVSTAMRTTKYPHNYKMDP
jgi:hypothetical protein